MWNFFKYGPTKENSDKMATYEVGVQLDDANEEQAEICITMLGRLKTIIIIIIINSIRQLIGVGYGLCQYI